MGIDRKAFEEVLADAKKKPSAYEIAFHRTWYITAKRLASWGFSEPFQMVFDNSEEHSMRFYSALRKMKRERKDIRDGVSGISFCDDRFMMPLQAADLLACATVREWRRGLATA